MIIGYFWTGARTISLSKKGSPELNSMKIVALSLNAEKKIDIEVKTT